MVKKINTILSYSMILVSLFFLIFQYIHKLFFLFFILSFLVSYIFTKFRERFSLTEKHLIYINIALWLNLFGEIYFYQSFQYYDKILHIITSLMIVSMIFNFFKTRLDINRYLIFLSTLGILTIFEIIEYYLQTFFGIPMAGVINPYGDYIMSPLDDTIADLSLGAISSSIYLIFKKF